MAKKAKPKTRKTEKKPVEKGSQFKCSQCGMVIDVVDPCDCMDPCELSCCGETMAREC